MSHFHLSKINAVLMAHSTNHWLHLLRLLLEFTTCTLFCLASDELHCASVVLLDQSNCCCSVFPSSICVQRRWMTLFLYSARYVAKQRVWLCVLSQQAVQQPMRCELATCWNVTAQPWANTPCIHTRIFVWCRRAECNLFHNTWTTITSWQTSTQKEGLPCTALANSWPANAQMSRPHWSTTS